MNDYEKLFFPFHYKWIAMTRELSDADFGLLIRKLLGDFMTDAGEPADLPTELLIPYRFIKDAAERVIEHKKKAGEEGRRLAEKRWGAKADATGEQKPKNESRTGWRGTKFVDFDVNEAFERALKRSYPEIEEDTKETAPKQTEGGASP